MAPSFFPNKQSSEPAPSGQSSEALLAVRTMQDDLKDIENGGRESEQPSAEIDQYGSAKTSLERPSSLPVNPFSEEGEELFQSRAKEGEHQEGNPFGIASPKNNRSFPNFSQQPMPENGLRPLVEQGGLLSNHPIIKKTPWLMIVLAGTVVILLVAAGIWYFFFSNEEQVAEPRPSSSVIEKTSGIPETLTPKQSPFALDKPNYLSINTEIVSPQDIRKILAQAADRIKEADTREPIEFLITDQNNNPLAFSRFAFLLKLDLNSEVIALADEAFSLYVYNDAGRPRIGLVLTFKDIQKAAPIIEKTEADLPYVLRALILEPDQSVGKKLSFRSTSYNQFSVRFSNIDSDQNLSLDYSLYGSQLFIGMSKNTLRAIIDASTR